MAALLVAERRNDILTLLLLRSKSRSHKVGATFEDYIFLWDAVIWGRK